MVFTRTPESDTLVAVHFDLAAWDDGAGDGVLTGRAQGEVARAALEAAIRAHPSVGEPVAIDLRRVRAMSVPFADGFFVPLLSSWLAGYYDDHPILVFGAKDDVSETIAAVMRMRNVAILSIEMQSGIDLLGGEPSLRETIRLASRLGKFSATDLGHELGITPQAANNRLKALVRLGALVRVPVVRPEGGREFEYQVPSSALPEKPGADRSMA
jgi:hypothetical protein